MHLKDIFNNILTYFGIISRVFCIFKKSILNFPTYIEKKIYFDIMIGELMRFAKLHADGNDFVFIGSPSQSFRPSEKLIQAICNRHYGIGADCAVIIQRSKTADYYMRVFNPDGFEAEICGNALRCSAEYVRASGYIRHTSLTVETKSGIRCIKTDNDSIITEIGHALIAEGGTLFISNTPIPYHFVNIGNPHCVIVTNTLSDEEFYFFSPKIETNERFPQGTNVEFVSIVSENEINMRVWERGIGETLSCTTGSCACAAVANALYHCSRNISVNQKGGTTRVNILECGNIFVRGKCSLVFTGDYKL